MLRAGRLLVYRLSHLLRLGLALLLQDLIDLRHLLRALLDWPIDRSGRIYVGHVRRDAKHVLLGSKRLGTIVAQNNTVDLLQTLRFCLDSQCAGQVLAELIGHAASLGIKFSDTGVRLLE
jgi:hypothetical protein